jgi:hypothetical protein
MYATQQQHAASPSWMLWHGLWSPQSLANAFDMMMLQTPSSLTEWVADSGALNHTTPDPGNIFLF